ncbi:capsid protein [Smacoviridae sp.]|nr:capsid protein [Smacoviridae sp.]
MMVSVRVSETYDLSTKVGKMGFVGIHTPTGALIDKLWSGLVLQYKKFRFVKCDVAMACASMLPADPLQIGVEAGEIAPQDMFNPILYRAVSNDTMNTFLSFIQNCATTSGVLASVNKGSVIDVNDADFKSATNTSLDQFQMYYGLLSSEGWRKAMPQSGLVMNGLYPLVYQTLSQYGINQFSEGVQITGQLNQVPVSSVDSGVPSSLDGGTVQAIKSAMLRGPSVRMPSINTMYFDEGGMPDVVPNSRAYVHSNTGEVPPAYVGLIVLPPAKLSQLYYRLKVTWTIEFTGLRPLTDIGSWGSTYAIGGEAYGTDYAEQSTAMTSKTAMVDTSGSDIVKIMEGA